jgi:acetyl esterase/lipase
MRFELAKTYGSTHLVDPAARLTIVFMTGKIVPLLLVLAVNTPAFAQSCPALHVRNPDGNYIIPGVKGDIRYGGDLALDAYVQRSADRRPSVVVIHGGAWSSGSRVAHIGQILEVLTQAGYNWFSVDYRLGGLKRFEESLADIRASLAWMRCRSRELGIDPGRLILLGEDSGAQLVALLAAQRIPGVIGAVLVGGFYDLTATPGTTKETDVALLTRVSPTTHVVPKMPALLLVHGSADGEAPIEQAQRYCRAVVRTEGDCRLVEVEGASHRSQNWWPSQWNYKREIVTWLSALAPIPTGGHQPHPGTPLLKDIVYSESQHLKLDAFIPPVSKPVPAIILVHGGGWEAGDKVTYVTPLFEPLARAGLAWFSIDYRLTPASTHRDQLEDLRRAIRFVRAEHARFNIDPTRIVLIGESASGHLVTQIAAEDAALAGVVSFYGVYDLSSMVTDTSPRSLLVRLFRRDVLDDEARALLRQYSPLYQAHKGMPPLLLVNGTGDRLWAQAQAFAQKLTAIGARHETITVEGAPHGLENWEGHPEWTAYKRRMVEWIGRVVR